MRQGRGGGRGRAEAGQRRGEAREATQTGGTQCEKEKSEWSGSSVVPTQTLETFCQALGLECLDHGGGGHPQAAIPRTSYLSESSNTGSQHLSVCVYSSCFAYQAEDSQVSGFLDPPTQCTDYSKTVPLHGPQCPLSSEMTYWLVVPKVAREMSSPYGSLDLSLLV